MAAIYYQRPEWPADTKITNLVPQHAMGEALGPETIIDAINRGHDALWDMFDGRPYEIPPGVFRASYGAVRHFQSRAVVPGSRNPETGKQESFIGIPGMDREDRCRPFTDADYRRFQGSVEAIDRNSMTLASDRNVSLIESASGHGFSAAGTGRLRPVQSAYVPNKGPVDVAEVIAQVPRELNDALAAMAQDEAGIAEIAVEEAEEQVTRAQQRVAAKKERASRKRA